MSGQSFLLPIKSLSDVTPIFFEFLQTSIDKRIFHSIDFTHYVRACAFGFLPPIRRHEIRYVKHVIWKMTIEIFRRLINLLCISTRRDESRFWLLCCFQQWFVVAVHREPILDERMVHVLCESGVSDTEHSFLMVFFMRKQMTDNRFYSIYSRSYSVLLSILAQ